MEQRDWFEEFVEDTHACMGIWYDKDDNEVEVEDTELTKEQVKRIAEKFRSDRSVDNHICELDNICMEYIAEELGLHS